MLITPELADFVKTLAKQSKPIRCYESENYTRYTFHSEAVLIIDEEQRTITFYDTEGGFFSMTIGD